MIGYSNGKVDGVSRREDIKFHVWIQLEIWMHSYWIQSLRTKNYLPSIDFKLNAMNVL